MLAAFLFGATVIQFNYNSYEDTSSKYGPSKGSLISPSQKSIPIKGQDKKFDQKKSTIQVKKDESEESGNGSIVEISTRFVTQNGQSVISN